MKLSDAITKYLPDSVANNEDLKGITLEMLSNHTSGLPRMPENAFNETTIKDNPYKNYDINMLYAYLKNFKRTSALGSYDYSNLGAALLGVILVNYCPDFMLPFLSCRKIICSLTHLSHFVVMII